MPEKYDELRKAAEQIADENPDQADPLMPVRRSVVLSLLDALSAVTKQRDAMRKALKEIETNCPCGARPESLQTHPHVTGCPVARGLAALSDDGGKDTKNA